MIMKKPPALIRLIIFMVFFVIFCISAYMVLSKLWTDRKENRAFAVLNEQVEANRNLNVPTQNIPGAEPTMLPAYASIYEQNQDLFGWIKIEDTMLNYPVMHTPEDPEHYLRRAFDNSGAVSGVPFLDGACFTGCGNYIIYGHNMKNGTMFSAITAYADEQYWREHPVIYFDTLYETGTYEVIAAFYSKAYSKDEANVFRYYEYTDLSDPARFAKYIMQVKSAALYDTGISANYGDDLITLSTCEYHVKNGRFVVVARKTDTAQD